MLGYRRAGKICITGACVCSNDTQQLLTAQFKSSEAFLFALTSVFPTAVAGGKVLVWCDMWAIFLRVAPAWGVKSATIARRKCNINAKRTAVTRERSATKKRATTSTPVHKTCTIGTSLGAIDEDGAVLTLPLDKIRPKSCVLTGTARLQSPPSSWPPVPRICCNNGTLMNHGSSISSL